MDNNIVTSSFEDILNHIQTENLPNYFLCFDNFEEQFPEFEQFKNIRFPVRLSCFLIVLCTQGKIKMKVGLKLIECCENQLLVIQPNKIFQFIEFSNNFKAAIVSLEKKFFNIQGRNQDAFSTSQYFAKQCCITINPNVKDEFLTLYSLIKMKLKEGNNPYKLEILQSYCYIIFCSICNLLMDNDKEITSSRQDDILRQFTILVEINYRDKHTLSFYADKMCITPKYLSTVVHKASGKFAYEWIDDYIMLEAQMLLLTSQMTITQISDTLSFSTPSHFGRFFKKQIGLTPFSFRKQNKKRFSSSK